MKRTFFFLALLSTGLLGACGQSGQQNGQNETQGSAQTQSGGAEAAAPATTDSTSADGPADEGNPAVRDPEG
jgi:hypothetical protein